MTNLGFPLGLALGLGLYLIVLAILWWRLGAPARKIPSAAEPFRRGRRGLGWLNSLLEEAGFERVDALVVFVAGILGGALSGLLVIVVVPIPALGAIACAVLPLLGYAYLVRVRAQRATRLRRAWPGVIDHLRAGVRSGHDVTGALCELPGTLPADISRPVGAFERDISLGLATDDALQELGRRFADPVADRIVEVLRMAHEVGGTDLPSVLLELQKSVRMDIAVRDDAHAQQSWIRSASVLAVAAPWAVLLVIGTRDATISAYQTAEGTGILFLGAVVSVVAFGMMRRIGALPAERRWLG